MAGIPAGSRAQSSGQADPPPAEGEAVPAGIDLDQQQTFDSTRDLTITSYDTLWRRAPDTTAQALAEEPGLFISYPLRGGGLPVLHGLSGPRVAILVDGLPLNTSISALNPAHLLAAVPVEELAGIEILRGPKIVDYGPASLGGMLGFYTRKPLFGRRRASALSAELSGHFDTADLSQQGHLALEGSLRNAGLRLSGSIKRFDDLAGTLDQRQLFSAYDQANANLAAGWAMTRSSILWLTYGMAHTYNLMLPALSQDQDFSRDTERLWDRVALTYEHHSASPYLQRLIFTQAYQAARIQQERFQLLRDHMLRFRDRADTYMANLSLQSHLPHNLLTYGVTFSFDWISSTAARELISAPTQNPLIRGRYVDASSSLDVALFLHDRLSVGPKLLFDLGARLDTTMITTPQDQLTNSAEQKTPYTMVVSELRGRYLVGDGLNLVMGFSQGYRAPHVDELTAWGFSEIGYDVPSQGLLPEKSLSTEAGIKVDLFGVLSGTAFYSLTYLDDPIVRLPAVWPFPELVNCPPRGADPSCPVYRRSNGDSAILHALEGSLVWTVHRGWSLFGHASWVRGQLKPVEESAAKEPLSQVPPLSGVAGVRYENADRDATLEAGVRWAAAQDRLSALDLHDLRICPAGPTDCDGTPAYAVVFLRAALQLSTMIRLGLGLENLTNERYRTYGSALEGAGLSARATVMLLLP